MSRDTAYRDSRESGKSCHSVLLSALYDNICVSGFYGDMMDIAEEREKMVFQRRCRCIIDSGTGNNTCFVGVSHGAGVTYDSRIRFIVCS